MSYRRKAPSAAKITYGQQLSFVRNGCFDGIPFQAHNAVALLEQLKMREPSAYAKFEKQAGPQLFFSKRLVDAKLYGSAANDAPVFMAPLPEHLIDPSDTVDDLEPRTFYHQTAMRLPYKDPNSKPTFAAPRCGATGLFFTREEVVDNLVAAASDLGFSSPFWIPASYPLLGGYQQLKQGSEAICISLTSSVVSVDDIANLPAKLLHQSLLRSSAASKGAKKQQPFIVTDATPLGMNALTGRTTANPFVQALQHRGLWVSYEQVLQYQLQLAPRKSTLCSADEGGKELFTVVELEQWEMHNADQLLVPGRLGLAKTGREQEGLTGENQVFS